MEIVLPNTSFHNACILHDCLGMSGAQSDEVSKGALNKHFKTDDEGNITHILGKKVISPEDCTWFELEGVKYDDRKESQIAIGLLDPKQGITRQSSTDSFGETLFLGDKFECYGTTFEIVGFNSDPTLKPIIARGEWQGEIKTLFFNANPMDIKKIN